MKILVGYVPTAEGDAAVEAAIQEAKLRGASVVLVNTTRGDAYVDERYAKQSELDSVRGRLESEGIEVSVRHAVSGGGEVADELLTIAAEEGVALIVIGLRRRSPVGKLLLGSTSQRLLLDADVPVLAVKAHD